MSVISSTVINKIEVAQYTSNLKNINYISINIGELNYSRPIAANAVFTGRLKNTICNFCLCNFGDTSDTTWHIVCSSSIVFLIAFNNIKDATFLFEMIPDLIFQTKLSIQ